MRIPEIALSCIKQMPHIKESLDEYLNAYNVSLQTKEKANRKSLKTETVDI